MIGLQIYYKGGPGSGNFGHVGRPGMIGGSGEGGGSAAAPRKRDIYANGKIVYKNSGSTFVDKTVQHILSNLSKEAITQLVHRNKPIIIHAKHGIKRTRTVINGYFGKYSFNALTFGMHSFKNNSVVIYPDSIKESGMFKGNAKGGIATVLLHELGHVATRHDTKQTPFDEAVANDWGRRYGRRYGFKPGILEG
jgi:hypothetical protein